MHRKRAFLVVAVALSSCVSVDALPSVPPSTPAPVFDRELKVKAVGRLILSKLGLQEPPVVSEEQMKNVSESTMLNYRLASNMNDRMMADKARQANVEERYYVSKTTTIRVKEQDVSSSLCNYKKQSRFYEIDVADLPCNSTAITSARFQIYYQPSQKTTSQDVLLSAYQLVEDCCLSKYPGTVLLDTKTVTSDHACFIEFDITNAVKSWVTNKSSYHGLEVEVSAGQCGQQFAYQAKSSSQFSTYLKTSTTDVVDYRPVLFVSSSHAMSGESTRRKRQTIDLEYCESLVAGQPNCCIYDFSLDFKKDLDWDWIIQPKKITPNQCSGECPDSWAQDSSHTQVLSEYYRLNPAGSVAPCCSPKKYHDLEIMYFDGVNPGAQIGLLPDMIVTTCECA